MIVTLNIDSEKPYFEIFSAVNKAFNKVGNNTKKAKGRLKKYSHQQMVACMV